MEDWSDGLWGRVRLRPPTTLRHSGTPPEHREHGVESWNDLKPRGLLSTVQPARPVGRHDGCLDYDAREPNRIGTEQAPHQPGHPGLQRGLRHRRHDPRRHRLLRVAPLHVRDHCLRRRQRRYARGGPRDGALQPAYPVHRRTPRRGKGFAVRDAVGLARGQSSATSTPTTRHPWPSWTSSCRTSIKVSRW